MELWQWGKGRGDLYHYVETPFIVLLLIETFVFHPLFFRFQPLFFIVSLILLPTYVLSGQIFCTSWYDFGGFFEGNTANASPALIQSALTSASAQHTSAHSAHSHAPYLHFDQDHHPPPSLKATYGNWLHCGIAGKATIANVVHAAFRPDIGCIAVEYPESSYQAFHTEYLYLFDSTSFMLGLMYCFWHFTFVWLTGICTRTACIMSD